jgi:hypothetical protein
MLALDILAVSRGAIVLELFEGSPAAIVVATHMKSEGGVELV